MNLYQKALDAIDKMFSDTSVSKEECKINLQTLIDEIQIRMESLDE